MSFVCFHNCIVLMKNKTTRGTSPMNKDMAVMSRKLANFLLSRDCKLRRIAPHKDYPNETKLVFYFEHTDKVDELMKIYREDLNLEKTQNGKNTKTL